MLLAKPTTFYNDTGRAARAIMDFYKVSLSDVLVIHDELALEFGIIRVRHSGSDAGNNGIKSLNAHLGQGYARLRIGIHSPLRRRMGDAAFVLKPLSQAEQEALGTAIIPATTHGVGVAIERDRLGVDAVAWRVQWYLYRGNWYQPLHHPILATAAC